MLLIFYYHLYIDSLANSIASVLTILQIPSHSVFTSTLEFLQIPLHFCFHLHIDNPANSIAFLYCLHIDICVNSIAFLSSHPYWYSCKWHRFPVFTYTLTFLQIPSLFCLLLVMFIVFCYIPMWYPGSGVVLDCIFS